MMNTKQRTKHLSQVQSTQVAEASKGSSQFDASDPATSEPTAVTNPVLSVDLESASKQVNRPLKCLEGIWIKAGQLISTNDAIVPAPGQDSAARMVVARFLTWSHQRKGESSAAIPAVLTGSPWEFVHIVWLLLRSIRNYHSSCLLKRGGDPPMSQSC